MTTHKRRLFYLVRHGEAKPKDEAPERPLTAAGAADVRRMAAWAAGAGIHVDEIRHSGKLRAQQTAEIFAEQLGTEAQAAPGLSPNDDVADVAASFDSEQGRIMLVGHLPFLERLAALLMSGNAEAGLVTLDAGALLELMSTDDGWRATGLRTDVPSCITCCTAFRVSTGYGNESARHLSSLSGWRSCGAMIRQLIIQAINRAVSGLCILLAVWACRNIVQSETVSDSTRLPSARTRRCTESNPRLMSGQLAP